MNPKTLTPEQWIAMVAESVVARAAPPESIADVLRLYRDHPVRFCVEWLGFTPTKHQRLILEAAVKHKRISVRSGRRVGKSYIFAALALWFYCCHGPDARVMLVATKEDQIKDVMWRALDMLVRRAKRPIPGVLGETHQSGLVWKQMFCEIKGVTARKPESVAGIAGAKIMYLVDEASGVDDKIFAAIAGNLAGGNAWECFISNPTRNEGHFFETHHSLSADRIGAEHGYWTLAISSYESPNVTGECGAAPIPGLATRNWIEGETLKYGDGSAWVRVHVLGEFAVNEERKIFSLAIITEAQERHKETEATGRLWIGLDPAGHGDGGDETAWAWRRGYKLLGVRRLQALSPAEHVMHTLAIINSERRPIDAKEPPVLVYDGGGPVGDDVRKAIVSYCDVNPTTFTAVRLLGSWPARKRPRDYTTVRDELAAVAEAWVRAGGTLLDDHKLVRDLHALEFDRTVKDRLQLIKKSGADGLRERLGRSPDTGDAFMMCCWEPLSLQAEAAENEARAVAEQVAVMDPFGSRFQSDGSAGRVFDPYG